MVGLTVAALALALAGAVVLLVSEGAPFVTAQPQGAGSRRPLR